MLAGAAGAAGATAFAQRVPGVVVGICAVLAAILAGTQTVVRPDQRARFNQTQTFALARLATSPGSICSSASARYRRSTGTLKACFRSRGWPVKVTAWR